MSDEEMEYSDSDYEDYYGTDYEGDMDHMAPMKNDPEYFDVACLTDTEVERLLNESVEQLSNSIQVCVFYCFIYMCISIFMLQLNVKFSLLFLDFFL